MPNDTPPHALRPDHGPDRHVVPHPVEARPDPFAVEGDHKAMRPNAHPEEAGDTGDGWAAAKGAVLFVLGAALVAWLLYTLLA
jgi:hypothetical protein